MINDSMISLLTIGIRYIIALRSGAGVLWSLFPSNLEQATWEPTVRLYGDFICKNCSIIFASPALVKFISLDDMLENKLTKWASRC
jgi:hypothetical protein